MLIALGGVTASVVVLCMCALVLALLRGMWGSVRSVVLFCLVTGVVALSLFRPHEHVFQGLDGSAYRLMGHAFADGRGLHDPDAELLRVPPELRRYVLLHMGGMERQTRDRSFEVCDLEGCGTQPYFYPLLPFCMAFFERGVGYGDLFVPVVSLLFVFGVVLGCMRVGGWIGVGVGGAALLATPLVAWMFRGGYVEAVCISLCGLSLLYWLHVAPSRRLDAVALLLLGLGISFHPTMVLVCVPLAAVFCLERTGGRARHMVVYLGSFGLGALPSLLMPLFAANPYRIELIVEQAQGKPEMFAMLVGVTLLVVAAVALLLTWQRIRRIRPPHWLGPRVLGCVVMLVGGAPLLVAGTVWDGRDRMWRGAGDMFNAMGWPLAALLLVSVGLVVVDRSRWRERVAVAVVLFSLPVFLYLRGGNPHGLWQMRRVVTSLVLLIVILAPVFAAYVRQAMGTGRRRGFIATAGVALCVVVGGYNARSSLPLYTVRYDRGADAFVESVSAEFGDSLVLFDYFTYSVPFAVRGDRVLGVSEQAAVGMPKISAWVRTLVEKGEPVMWVSAYGCPGIEDGVRLEPIGTRSVTLPRVRAKAAVPAAKTQATVEMALMRVVPATEPGGALDKVFGIGRRGHAAQVPQLAVRGPWGRSDISLRGPDGVQLPAQWSREGSQVLGPVPLPGQAVEVVVEASACRQDRQDQVLLVCPPWCTNAVPLRITNGWTRAACVIECSDHVTDNGAYTGAYTLTSRYPYDPALEGISGFNKDLGALVRRIQIQIVGDDESVERGGALGQ